MQESFEKKDIHESGKLLAWYTNKIQKSSMSDIQKKKILQFVDDLKIGKAGKKVKNHRLASYLQMLINLHKHFKKDLDKISEKESTDFYKDLQDNKIRRNNGLPYSQNTKDLFVRTLKRYLGWAFRGRNNPRYRMLAGWMKEDQPKSNKRAITLEQAQKVISKEKSIRNRALFIFLFDSGARIEEALNIRLLDLEVHKRNNQKDEYYMVRIRYSKTMPRRISLPLSTNLLNQWLKEHPIKKQDSFLFPLEYDNARKIIRMMSQRVLGFSLTPHELRHSSVTFYVQKFGLRDIAGFYYRFGWVFGSREAKTYIDEHLIGGEQEQEKLIRIVEADKVEQLEKEISELRRDIQKLWDRFGTAVSIEKTMLKAVTIDKKAERGFAKRLNRILPEKEPVLHEK